MRQPAATTLLTSSVVLLLSLWHSPLTAQVDPTPDLNNILFEAYPLPAADTPAASAAALPYRSMAPQQPFSFIGESPQLPAVADGGALEATVASYEASLTSLEADSDSPFSPDQFEQLLDLGAAYQQLGRYDEALTTLDKAEFLTRINNGLYGPEQFRVVEQMVETHIANGQPMEAQQKQQYLLYRQQQFYGADNTALVPAYERLGDWAMDTFASGIQQSNSIGFTINATRRGRIMTPREVAVRNLDVARFRYFQAIRTLVLAGDYHNPQLLVLEEKMLQSLYLAAHRIGLMDNPRFYLDGRTSLTGSRISLDEFEGNMVAYTEGRNSLRRSLIYQQSNAKSDAVALLQTQLQLADWHMLFNRQTEAAAVYADAWKLAHTPPLDSFAPALLQPAVPLQLPLFIALPHSRAVLGIANDSEQEFEGYIDVKLKMTHRGDVRRMEVIGKSANATGQLERRLRRLVRGAPFRPRLVDGVPVASDDIGVRYYFAEIR